MARRALDIALALCVLLTLSISPAAAAEFPAGFGYFHTYAEMEAVLDAAVADHPGIARKFSIGRSYQGRQIWALKISDNVGTDESEPEAMIDGLMHARERASAEMAIYLVRLLTDGYGGNQRITNIVNTREIFVIPMVNPDGGEYDISGGTFHQWRRNRQPIPGSSAIGVDLNRNSGFNWGCCGGSSGTPGAWNYRGPSPWFAPEIRAFRDFFDSRVVGGRQQLSVGIDFHSAGRQVLWPYGYTKTDVPNTMTTSDHSAFVGLGRDMAALNGYTAEQGSDLYITDGDSGDWAYYRHRVFMYAFEMAPGSPKRYYPTAQQLATDIERNRPAVLLLLEEADCPYRAAGLGTTHCGPLNDDFEAARGWRVDPSGTDTANDGTWQRAKPQKTTTSAGTKQPSSVPSGRLALVTNAVAGGNAGANDVDGGMTSVLSPPVRLGDGQAWTLRFRYTFAHNAASSSADFLRVRVVGSSTSTVFSIAGKASERNAGWQTATANVSAFAGQTVRLLIEASDRGADSLVEAGIDDVRVYRTP
jgi:hypothetical protein